MEKYTWNDGIKSRSRRPFLFLRKGGEILPFEGESIPGFCVVTNADYEKAGKWSNTSYSISLGAGVTPIPIREGWGTGTLLEGLSDFAGFACETWIDVGNALGVTPDAARELLKKVRPGAVKRLDETEKALAALDEQGDEDEDVVLVTKSFGSPTKRQRREGFWSAPRPVCVEGKEVAQISLPEGESWVTVRADRVQVSSDSVRVLEIVRARGYGGGTVSVKMAVRA